MKSAKMERRPHPTYARRTAALTYGLVAAGLACLLLGIAVRGTAWRNAETILNLGFCGALVAVLLHWFGRGEATACPRCGRTLKSDAPHTRGEPLTFVCPECQIEWLTQTSEDISNHD